MVDRSALAHAIAGASASALAVALFYPLDQLRVHEQLSTEPQEERKRFHILRALRLRLEAVGIAGLYQGLPSSLVAIVWANFFYFFAYDRTGEAPQLGARASSGRAWQLWAARHSQPTGIAATASEARACPCLHARLKPREVLPPCFGPRRSTPTHHASEAPEPAKVHHL